VYLKVAQHVDTTCLFYRYVSYDNSVNLGSTSCNRGCLIVQCTVVLPTVHDPDYFREDDYVDVYVHEMRSEI
jgi:hypothetical protein